MKKNLRIVSAAAAALLAVAPVAASATVANAATGTGVWGSNNLPTIIQGAPETSATSHTGSVTDPHVLTFSTDANIKTSDSVKTIDSNWIKSNIKTLIDGNAAGNIAGVNASNVKVYYKNANNENVAATKFETGTTYYIVATVAVGGLTDGQYYKLSESDAANTAQKATNGVLQDITVTIPVTAYDPNAKGTPYFSGKDNYVVTKDSQKDVYQVSGSSLSLTPDQDGNVTVQQVLDKARTAATFHQDINDTTGSTTFGTADEVIDSLKKQNITVNGTGASAKFALPDNGFSVTLTDKNTTNHKTATLLAEFSGAKADRNMSPFFFNLVDGVASQPEENTIYQIKQGSNFNPLNFTDINGKKTSFYAIQTKNNTNQIVPSVVSSDVDANKPGIYTVKLSATNTAGNKTNFSYRVVVVASGAQVVYANGAENVKTYSVYSGVATENPYNTLKDLTQVWVGSEKTVDGVSYTQISTTSAEDAKNSSVWVKTSSLTKAVPEESTSAKVMYKSAIYAKGTDGKMTKTDEAAIAGYTDKDFVKDDNGNVKVYTINDETFVKVPNKNEYVRARNVEGLGSKMTLKHNAYVYKSNGKRANKKVLKKGSTITVYGGQCTMKKYSKKTARIGVNQYVKVANIKTWTLAK